MPVTLGPGPTLNAQANNAPANTFYTGNRASKSPWNARWGSADTGFNYFDPDTFDFGEMMGDRAFSQQVLGAIGKDQKWWDKRSDVFARGVGRQWWSGQGGWGKKLAKAGLQPERGDFGSGPEITGITGMENYDQDQWNQMLFEMSRDFPGYGDIQVTPEGTFVDPSAANLITPDLMGKYNTFAFALENEVDQDNVITGPDGNPTLDPEYVAQQEQDLAAVEAKFSQDEADAVWEMDTEGKTSALSSLYDLDGDGEMTGVEYASAADDWTSFQNSKIPGTNQTYGEFFGQGGTIPTIGPDGFVVQGDIDDTVMDDLLGSFAGWKAKKTETADFAAQYGADVSDVVVSPDGGMALDPDKYDFDADTGQYTAKPTAAQTGVDATTALMNEFFGADRMSEVLTALDEGIVTDEEIQSSFADIWAPNKFDWETFGAPEAKARGTETGGGLGGGVASSSLKAQSAYTAQRVSAEAQYRQQVKNTNLQYIDMALKTAKTPADIAEVYSRVGVNMASTDLIRTQASNIVWDQNIEDSQNWAALGISEANMNYINAQTDLVDSQSLFNMYQLAAAEGGFDANTLAMMTNYYMQQQTGGFASPAMPFMMALADMSMLAAFGVPGENAKIGGVLSGAASGATTGFLIGGVPGAVIGGGLGAIGGLS